MTAGTTGSPPRSAGIQALRAVACLLVILQHAIYFACVVKSIDYRPYLPVNFGRIGVSLFFVISGYVMGTILDEGRRFLWNRIRRIYPAYWIAVMLTALILAGAGTGWHMTWQSLTLVPATGGNDSFRIPYWTLCYEMAFYALTFVLILMKFRRGTISWLCLGWIMAILLVEAYLPSGDMDSAEGFAAAAFPGWRILLSPMTIFFAAGLFGSTSGVLSTKPVHASKPAAAALLLWAVGNWLKLATPAPAFCLLALAYLLLLESVKNAEVPALISRLGDFSYGAYLIHMSVMVAIVAALQAAGVTPRLLITFALLAGAGTLAGCAYGWFEFRLHRRYFR